MNLRKVENSKLLTPLLRLDDKKNPLLPVGAEVFFLTSPFIERGNQGLADFIIPGGSLSSNFAESLTGGV